MPNITGRFPEDVIAALINELRNRLPEEKLSEIVITNLTKYDCFNYVSVSDVCDILTFEQVIAACLETGIEINKQRFAPFNLLDQIQLLGFGNHGLLWRPLTRNLFYRSVSSTVQNLDGVDQPYASLIASANPATDSKFLNLAIDTNELIKLEVFWRHGPNRGSKRGMTFHEKGTFSDYLKSQPDLMEILRNSG